MSGEEIFKKRKRDEYEGVCMSFYTLIDNMDKRKRYNDSSILTKDI